MASKDEFVVIAHRGFSSQWPENTFAAFSAALSAGFPHIELDVQLTSDGVPMVCVHATNPSLNSTLPGIYMHAVSQHYIGLCQGFVLFKNPSTQTKSTGCLTSKQILAMDTAQAYVSVKE